MIDYVEEIHRKRPNKIHGTVLVIGKGHLYIQYKWNVGKCESTQLPMPLDANEKQKNPWV